MPAESQLNHRYRNEANVAFVEDAPEIDAPFMSMSLTADFPHHLWTDCYLAALAHHRTCRIISSDADFKRFPELKFLHLSA